MKLFDEIGYSIPVPKLGASCVHVWQISTALVTSETEALRDILTPDEIDRASKFHFERDRRSFLVCRAVLRRLLGCYTSTDANQIRLSYGPHGKPSLDRPRVPELLRFNLSHSGGVALLAFALGRDVGVDVELMREVDFLSLAESSFSEKERAAVLARSNPSRSRLFYRYWTCKEACIKADGKGLSIPLKGFSILPVARKAHWRKLALLAPIALPAEMRIRTLGVGSGYAAAVAAVGSDWNIRRIHVMRSASHSVPDSPTSKSRSRKLA